MSFFKVYANASRKEKRRLLDEGEGRFRLSICRAMVSPERDGTAADGISWDELQELKRQAGFGDRWAVEVYPADESVVNVANMRHLWLMPEPLLWAWNAS